MEDSDIIEAFFRRDEDAITETKVKYGPHLYNLSFNILKNREDAEECENEHLREGVEQHPARASRFSVRVACEDHAESFP